MKNRKEKVSSRAVTLSGAVREYFIMHKNGKIPKIKKLTLCDVFLLAGVFLLLEIVEGCSDKNEGKVSPPPGPDTTTTKPVYEVTEVPNPFSWVAIDGQNNIINPSSDNYPDATKRKNKYVGILYFLWHGCHGYDIPSNHNDVQAPSASDTKSPFNIPNILAANPVNPEWGPPYAMHHWGEPYLGYYVAGDEWIIRKHAQMLSDAGVDVLFLDVTNGYTYIPIVKEIGKVFMEMRAEGSHTPQFAFLLHSGIESTFNTIYSEIYDRNLYSDLWFKWLGKPLLLADPNEIPAAHKSEFTIRESWFLWNEASADLWFGDGVDKWPWGGLYPQQAGVHGGKNECVSVVPATHPVSNIGRSYDVAKGYEPSVVHSGEGIYFKSQFERAKELDPSMLFITGWNEWVAQRQIASGNQAFLGSTVSSGGTYFVDEYNHEFSRDIEPLNGDFGDNYYYMLADYIRQFKGTKSLPVFNTSDAIKIDGDFSDWSNVRALYGDDKGDVVHHNHFGWGNVGTLTNNTGRNDIVLSKVATDGKELFFYVKTADDITPYTDADWMRLFIGVNNTDPAWEGFNYVVNRTVKSKDETLLEKCQGGWKWSEKSSVEYSVSKNEMEIAIPLSDLGITNPDSFTIDFKWIDNAASNGDIQTCMRDGDAAPNGRFRYRYIFKK
jgi:hypothetical protein